MSSKLSICIPTYNRAPFLDEALASIVRQATDEMEIVVSDNASTDNTQEIIARYQQSFPRLRYRRWPENKGADCNYLRVIQLAEGEYCWFLGSDDALVEGAFTKIMPQLGKAEILLLDRINMRYDMKKLINVQRLHGAKPGTYFTGSDPESLQAFFEQAIELGSMFSYISSIIIRRDLWERLPVRTEFLGSCWIHVVKLFEMLRAGADLIYIGEPLVLNRTNNDFFEAAYGSTKRLQIDLDYVRIARKLFADNALIEEKIISIVKECCFSWRFLLLNKYKIFQTDGDNGLKRLEKTYYECFSSKPDYKKKIWLWKYAPIWLLSIFWYTFALMRIFRGFMWNIKTSVSKNKNLTRYANDN